ncbi:hypothetical protein AB205_0092700, partial [Aquarana catesbeiana]
RRHGSSSKAPLTPPSSSVYSLYSTPSTKNKVAGSSTRTSSSASSNSKLIKSPKEKLQIGGNNRSMHPTQYSKAPQDKIMTPSVKVEKMHTIQKTDGALQKSAAGSTCSSSVSSSVKTGLNWQSIPKPPLPSPGQIPNGKGILSTPPNVEKKAEDTNCRKYLHKRLSGYRRAVQGRKKGFDVLLAEHKNKTREKEQLRHAEQQQQQTSALREPHPSPSKSSQEPHQNSHGHSTPEVKPSVPSKAKPHNPSLPRPLSYPAQHSGNAPNGSPSVHESQPVVPAAEPTSRLSSDEGEGDEKEEPAEKLDCHYSDHHPRPAALYFNVGCKNARSCLMNESID